MKWIASSNDYYLRIKEPSSFPLCSILRQLRLNEWRVSLHIARHYTRVPSNRLVVLLFFHLSQTVMWHATRKYSWRAGAFEEERCFNGECLWQEVCCVSCA